MRTLFGVFSLMTVLFVSTNAALAQSGYEVTCNSNGYVVTYQSQPPFYLGKSCDAFHERMGGGHWCWATQEIRVSFPRGDSAVDGFRLNICPAINSETIPCACWRNPLPED